MNDHIRNQKKSLARNLISRNDFLGANRTLAELYQNSPDGETCYLLGVVSENMRNFAMAENYMKQAVNIQPNSDANWQGLGMCQMLHGKYAEAISSFNQCLTLNPKNTQAINNLGNICRETGKINEAEIYFRNALKIQPNNSETLSFLGNIYLEKCMYPEAISYYKKSVKKNPNYLDAHYNLGCAYQGLGEHDMALKHYRQAKKINPTATQPVTAIANSLEKQGKNEKALKQIDPLIKQNIITTDVVTTYARICINTRSYLEGIELSNKFLGTTKSTLIPPISEQEIRFNLGDLYNKNKEYDKAFQQYKIANEIRPHKYNRTATEDYFKSITQIFSQNEITNLPISNNLSDTPIFIVGMPRSGTSLIEQILASHNKISGAGELPYIADIANKTNSSYDAYPGSIKNVDTSFLNEQSKNYMSLLRKHGLGEKYVTDKMPHNFIYIGLIKMLFPNCKVIHCLRDPVDVCLSIYFHNFNSNHPYSDNLANLGHYYNQYKKLISHWSKIYDDSIHNVSYENIISEPKKHITELLNHLDLEWQDNCSKFYENKRTVNTPSYSQVRQPIYNTSIKRWKNYEQHIDDLIREINKDFLV